MATGAYVLAIYIAARSDLRSADKLADIMQIMWWVLVLVWLTTRPAQERGSEVKDPTPARSGTGVVLACGLGAAFFLAQDATLPQDYILPTAILFATAAVAIAVHRFASKHANEIGEARFPTISSQTKRTD